MVVCYCDRQRHCGNRQPTALSTTTTLESMRSPLHARSEFCNGMKSTAISVGKDWARDARPGHSGIDWVIPWQIVKWIIGWEHELEEFIGSLLGTAMRTGTLRRRRLARRAVGCTVPWRYAMGRVVSCMRTTPVAALPSPELTPPDGVLPRRRRPLRRELPVFQPLEWGRAVDAMEERPCRYCVSARVPGGHCPRRRWRLGGGTAGE